MKPTKWHAQNSIFDLFKVTTLPLTTTAKTLVIIATQLQNCFCFSCYEQITLLVGGPRMQYIHLLTFFGTKYYYWLKFLNVHCWQASYCRCVVRTKSPWSGLIKQKLIKNPFHNDDAWAWKWRPMIGSFWLSKKPLCCEPRCILLLAWFQYLYTIRVSEKPIFQRTL